MEKIKELDIFDLGKDTFNFHNNSLKTTKKNLKNYLTIIDSFVESITNHKQSLKKVYKDLKQSSPIDKPFNFLKKIEILINLEYNYTKSFLANITTIFEELKKTINNMINTITDYLSSSQKLSMNIKNSSENYYIKYDKLIESLEETELAIIDEYTKKKYKTSISKFRKKDKDKDDLVNDSLVLEREFLNVEFEIKDKANNYIDEYNLNMKNIKPKMAQLNEDTKNGVLNIIKTMKKDYNLFITMLHNESENISNIDNNDNFKKEYGEYLNYIIKKDKNCEILKKINLDKYVLKIIKEEEKNILENEQTKMKNNKITKVLTFTGEDVYNIAKTMYDYNFEMVNKDLYNLDEEENKLKITELMGKLLNYNFDNHHVGEEGKITYEEKKYLFNQIFLKEDYFMKFLTCLNNYRVTGRYEMTQELFNTIKTIFEREADNLLLNNNKKISRYLLILSQTFYIMKNSNKHFLQKEIKNKKLFRMVEFWIEHLEKEIFDELEKFEDELKKNSLIYSQQKKKKKIEDILFSKIASLVASLNGFELEKEKIDQILVPIMNKYELPEEMQQSIFALVNVKK